MRSFAFYIFLCLFLLSGGQLGYAQLSHTDHHIPAHHAPAKRSHSKLSNSDKGSSILDEAEIDLDEDHLGDHDTDATKGIKSLASNRSYYHSLCLTFSSLSLLSSYVSYSHLREPLVPLSSPLYISQRVLRI